MAKHKLWCMVPYRIDWLHKKHGILVQLQFLERVATSTQVVHAHPACLRFGNMGRLGDTRRFWLWFWLGLCGHGRWGHSSGTCGASGSGSRWRRRTSCTGHDLELGRSRNCWYGMGTLRRTASLDRSLRFGRYFHWRQLRSLFCHRSRGKVNGDFRWSFFDTSEHDVRKLDDAPSDFLINVGSTKSLALNSGASTN